MSARFAPLLIFFAALALRLWGIGWGLPNAGRFFSYHPDESVVVSYSLAVNPFLLLLDPGFYNYGSLALLVNGAVIHAGQMLGLIGADPLPGVPSASALLAARLVSVFCGALTCLFLCGTGKRLYHCASAGLVAGALYAIAPLAVQHGHFATVDVPATFYLAGALFFAARHLSKDVRPRDLFWAGVWAGLAAATKYNVGLVLFAVIAAWRLAPLAAPQVWGGDWRGLGGGVLLGFLIGCPGALLNTPAWLAGVAFEARHVREGHGAVFAATPPALIFHAGFNLRWGLGWPLLVIVLAGLGLALWRRRPGDLVLLAFVVPYYLLLGLADVKFARYTLPLFPPLLLLVGAMIAFLAESNRRRVTGLAAGLVGAAGAWALLFSLALDNTMTKPDPRDQALEFLRQEQQNGTLRLVGFATGPWFYSPPLHPLLSHFSPAAARQAAGTTTAPRLIPAVNAAGNPVAWDTDLLTRSNPDAVTLSEINEYADAERAGDPAARVFLSALRARYLRVRVFAQPAQVFGLRFTNPDTDHGRRLPAQDLPHDMLYTNPTTVVFSR